MTNPYGTGSPYHPMGGPGQQPAVDVPRPTQHPPPRRSKAQIALIAAAALAVLVAAGVLVALLRAKDPSDSVVQIRCGQGGGSGFFVNGRNGQVYVVTARHVIDNGDPIEVIRRIGPSAARYAVSYREVTVVASDPRTDLALLRLKNVRPDELRPLALATGAVTANASCNAYGFPATNLLQTRTLDVSRTPGTVIQVNTRLDFRDPLNPQRVIEHSAVPALILNNPITNGNSGGPLLNDDGQVIGVIAQKDRQHEQSAAIHVDAVRALIDRARDTEVNAARVQTRLRDIIANYLGRAQADSHHEPYVALADLPLIRSLAEDFTGAIRTAVQQRNSTSNDELMRQTWPIDLTLAVLEGSTDDFPTMRQAWIRDQVADCIRRNPSSGIQILPTARQDECARLLYRPLAYDMMRNLVRYQPTVRVNDVVVTQVRTFDAEDRLYRVAVNLGQGATFDLQVQETDGDIWFRIFDRDGTPAARATQGSVPVERFAGTWVASDSSNNPNGPTSASSLRMVTSVEASSDTIVGELASASLLTAQSGQQWSCNNASSLRYDIRQAYRGQAFLGRGVLRLTGETRNVPTECASLVNSVFTNDIAAVLNPQDENTMRITTIGANGMVFRFTFTRPR